MKISQSRLGVEVIIDDHTNERVYTTFDAVTGRVKIMAAQNMRLDEVKITLEGLAKTSVENLSPAGGRFRPMSQHSFLKLVMPIRDSDYPKQRIAEAGRTYIFPFSVSRGYSLY
jgi:hypothetical protein